MFDRTRVILAIFQRHARSREAVLQVEMARLAYWRRGCARTGAAKNCQGSGTLRGF